MQQKDNKNTFYFLNPNIVFNATKVLSNMKNSKYAHLNIEIINLVLITKAERKDSEEVRNLLQPERYLLFDI